MSVNGALVSVKVNMLVAEFIVCGNSVQTEGCIRFVVHSTWKRLFDEAVHANVMLVDVTTALVMEGAGGTKTVKPFVALAGGRPSSMTTVVNLKASPASAGPGVQSIIPPVLMVAFVAGAGNRPKE